eukprot:TRINITY_DN889_c0_g1_i2.p1 TRINITY_DN889_c0_g1~~TRINITY_DN889_c0_g1_i2.p1  ORF type:complete len:180 (+),score=57.32 TRINITY_DN889_c0_g1_i2:87-626(+)
MKCTALSVVVLGLLLISESMAAEVIKADKDKADKDKADKDKDTSKSISKVNLGLAMQLMKNMDMDKDGKINRAELLAFVKQTMKDAADEDKKHGREAPKHDNPDQETDLVFKTYDKDQSGMLEQQEFNTAVNAYYMEGSEKDEEQDREDKEGHENEDEDKNHEMDDEEEEEEKERDDEA